MSRQPKPVLHSLRTIASTPAPTTQPAQNQAHYEPMYAEPRITRDRRQQTQAELLPSSGCRRQQRRRHAVYLRDDQWWMHRNYCDNE